MLPMQCPGCMLASCCMALAVLDCEVLPSFLVCVCAHAVAGARAKLIFDYLPGLLDARSKEEMLLDPGYASRTSHWQRRVELSDIFRENSTCAFFLAEQQDNAGDDPALCNEELLTAGGSLALCDHENIMSWIASANSLEQLMLYDTTVLNLCSQQVCGDLNTVGLFHAYCTYSMHSVPCQCGAPEGRKHSIGLHMLLP
jgi:hypothetical protein